MSKSQIGDLSAGDVLHARMHVTDARLLLADLEDDLDEGNLDREQLRDAERALLAALGSVRKLKAEKRSV